LASALAHLGRLDAARSAVKSRLALNPIYTISRDRAVWTGDSDNPTFLAGLELLFDGLRKAGRRTDRAARRILAGQTDSNRNKGS
jgi:hypothetical protein